MENTQIDHLWDEAFNLINNAESEKAIVLCLKILEINPTYIPALIGIAGCYLLKKNADKMRHYASKVLDIDVSNRSAQYYIGESYLFINKIKEAKEYFEKVIYMERDHKYALNGMARCLIIEKELSKAMNIIKKLMGDDPYNVQTLFLYSTCCYELLQYENALQAAYKVLETDPNHTECIELINRINLFHKRFNYKMIPIMVDGDKLSDQSLLHLAREKMLKKYYEKAKECLSKVQNKHMLGVEYYSLYGLCLVHLNEYEEAKFYFEKGFLLDGENFEILFNYGYFQIRIGNLNSALLYFERCFIIKPLDPYVNNYIYLLINSIENNSNISTHKKISNFFYKCNFGTFNFSLNKKFTSCITLFSEKIYTPSQFPFDLGIKDNDLLSKIIFISFMASENKSNLFMLMNSIGYIYKLKIEDKNRVQCVYPIIPLIVRSIIKSVYLIHNGKEISFSHKICDRYSDLFNNALAKKTYGEISKRINKNKPDLYDIEFCKKLLINSLPYAKSDNNNIIDFYNEMARTAFCKFYFSLSEEDLNEAFNLCNFIISEGYQDTLFGIYKENIQLSKKLFIKFKILSPENRELTLLYNEKLISLGRELRETLVFIGEEQDEWLKESYSLGVNQAYMYAYLSSQNGISNERICKSVESVETSLFQKMTDDFSLNALYLQSEFVSDELKVEISSIHKMWKEAIEHNLDDSMKKLDSSKVKNFRNRWKEIIPKDLPSSQMLGFDKLWSCFDHLNEKNNSIFLYLFYTELGGGALVVDPSQENKTSRVTFLDMPKLTTELVQSCSRKYIQAYQSFLRNSEYVNQSNLDYNVVKRSFEKYLSEFDNSLFLLGRIITPLIKRKFFSSKPFKSRVSTKKICIIPYGDLSFFPIHAMYKHFFIIDFIRKRKTNWSMFWGRNYLYQKLDFCYLPSIRAQGFHRSELKENKLSPQKKVQAWALLSNDDPASEFFLSEVEESFPSNSRLSVEKSLFLGERSKEDFFNSLQDAAFAQVSTHGVYDTNEFVFRSGLQVGRTSRHLVSIFEILSQKLTGIRFIFLSSCDSGLRELSMPNEGLSVATAFMLSGVQGSVSSMYSVSGHSTSHLVSLFWQSLSDQSDSSDIDLVRLFNSAQKQLRKDVLQLNYSDDELFKYVDKRHPYFWAGHYFLGV